MQAEERSREQFVLLLWIPAPYRFDIELDPVEFNVAHEDEVRFGGGCKRNSVD
jgi:hypothetical protein